MKKNVVAITLTRTINDHILSLHEVYNEKNVKN